MGTIIGYAGTYASPESAGVYRFTLDGESGAVSPPELFCPAPDAKYLSLREGLLAAPVVRQDGAGVILLNVETGRAVERLTERIAACHVAQDETRVYTANFHEGTVRVYGKPDLAPVGVISIAPGAGCHQVLLHKGNILVPCMELDAIRVFDAATLAPAGEIAFPAGSGPRHGVFDREHRRLFVAGQRSHSVFSFRVEGKGLSLEGEFPVLERWEPDDETAAIRLSPDERYLYVSVRGPDVIAAFRVDGGRLVPGQRVSSGGKHPRDFALSPDGRFLLAANRFGGGIVCFRRDADTGEIGPVCGRAELPQVVSIVF